MDAGNNYLRELLNTITNLELPEGPLNLQNMLKIEGAIAKVRVIQRLVDQRKDQLMVQYAIKQTKIATYTEVSDRMNELKDYMQKLFEQNEGYGAMLDAYQDVFGSDKWIKTQLEAKQYRSLIRKEKIAAMEKKREEIEAKMAPMKEERADMKKYKDLKLKIQKTKELNTQMIVGMAKQWKKEREEEKQKSSFAFTSSVNLKIDFSVWTSKFTKDRQRRSFNLFRKEPEQNRRHTFAFGQKRPLTENDDEPAKQNVPAKRVRFDMNTSYISPSEDSSDSENAQNLNQSLINRKSKKLPLSPPPSTSFKKSSKEAQVTDIKKPVFKVPLPPPLPRKGNLKATPAPNPPKLAMLRRCPVQRLFPKGFKESKRTTENVPPPTSSTSKMPKPKEVKSPNPKSPHSRVSSLKQQIAASPGPLARQNEVKSPNPKPPHSRVLSQKQQATTSPGPVTRQNEVKSPNPKPPHSRVLSQKQQITTSPGALTRQNAQVFQRGPTSQATEQKLVAVVASTPKDKTSAPAVLINKPLVKAIPVPDNDDPDTVNDVSGSSNDSMDDNGGKTGNSFEFYKTNSNNNAEDIFGRATNANDDGYGGFYGNSSSMSLEEDLPDFLRK